MDIFWNHTFFRHARFSFCNKSFVLTRLCSRLMLAENLGSTQSGFGEKELPSVDRQSLPR